MALLEEYMADETFRRVYHQESLNLDITEAICGYMNERKITRKELADRLGKSKGFVSQVLNGSRNMTLKTLAEITYALGCKVCPTLEPLTTSCEVQETHILKSTQEAGWKPAEASGTKVIPFKSGSKVIPSETFTLKAHVSIKKMDLAVNCG